MCGIVFVSKEQKAVAQATWKRYKAQDTRGKKGFGYVAIAGNVIKNYQRASEEKDIEEMLKKEDSNTILFHHRFPTSTANFKETAHPIKVQNKELTSVYYVVHNGIITNDYTLKRTHENMGYKYVTNVRKEWITSEKTYFQEEFNDSECLAIEVARMIDGKSDKIHCEGSYAFMVIAANAQGVAQKVYYGTNGGNPLKVKEAKGFVSICSEGEGKEIEAGILYSFDLRKRVITELHANVGKVQYKHMGYESNQYPAGGYFGNEEYTISSQLEELEWDEQCLRERMQFAKEAAERSMNYSEVEELKAELNDIQAEREALELEAGLKY